MKLEPIDTSTTAGKAEVMRLAAEGRKVAFRYKNEQEVTDTIFHMASAQYPPVWDWRQCDYAIISEPVGPDEVWVVVGESIQASVFKTAHDAHAYWVRHVGTGGGVIKYQRADA